MEMLMDGTTIKVECIKLVLSEFFLRIFLMPGECW